MHLSPISMTSFNNSLSIFVLFQNVFATKDVGVVRLEFAQNLSHPKMSLSSLGGIVTYLYIFIITGTVY